jgi:hypothetical protein
MNMKISLEGFGERLHYAAGAGSYQAVAEKLGLEYAATRRYILDERLPPLHIILKISDVTGCSLHWLLTGRGDWRPKTPDGEIMGKLSPAENSAVRKLMSADLDLPAIVHTLITEALVGRGLITKPSDASAPTSIFPVSKAGKDRNVVEVFWEGEINTKGELRTFDPPKKLSLPLYYTMIPVEDRPLNAASFFCLRDLSGEVEGASGSDMVVVCTDIRNIRYLPVGQPVVVLLRGENKALVKKYLPDPLEKGRATFAPVSGEGPALSLKPGGYEVRGVVLGIGPWSSVASSER